MEIDAKDGSGLKRATAHETSSVLTAAYSTHGWLGGLDLVRQILNAHPDQFKEKIEKVGFDGQPTTLPLNCVSISGHGLRQCQFEGTTEYNAQQEFGGSWQTQFIGRIICALCHEIEPRTAVKIFLDSVLSIFIDPHSDLFDALSHCLSDDQCLRKIVNEGHARGLNEMFCKVAGTLKPPTNISSWNTKHMRYGMNECHLVAGVLSWLMSGATKTYYTESILAMRLLAYLQAIGYPTPDIIYRKGRQCQGDFRLKSLIFLYPNHVLDNDNDDYDDDEEDEEEKWGWINSQLCDPKKTWSKIPDACEPFHHYTYRSVGVLLQKSVGDAAIIDPDDLQTQFTSIYSHIRSRTNIRYGRGSSCMDLNVYLRRRDTPKDCSAITSDLAKIYFPRSHKFFAHCYSEIANVALFRIVSDAIPLNHRYSDIPEELIQFRAVTAAIVIAVLGRVTGNDFKKVRHISSIDLKDEAWLNELCPLVEKLCTRGIAYNELILALAAIHCAANVNAASIKRGSDPTTNSSTRKSESRIIAWRNGSLGIVPNLLLGMKTTISGLRICLIDKFWADAVTDEYGAIETSCIPHQCAKRNFSSREQQKNYVEFDFPRLDWPQTNIELNIESVYYGGRQTLCLAGRVWSENLNYNGNNPYDHSGRVWGEPLGRIGLFDVLRQLLDLYSLEPNIPCPGHTENDDELEKYGMVIYRDPKWHHMFIGPPHLFGDSFTYTPVRGHEHWALFLSAIVCHFKAKVIRGCIRCVDLDQVRHLGRMLFIGLGREEDESSDRWEIL